MYLILEYLFKMKAIFILTELFDFTSEVMKTANQQIIATKAFNNHIFTTICAQFIINQGE